MMIRRLKTFSPIILVITSIAGTLTFILTWIGKGMNEHFLESWIRSFIPTAFLLAPTAIAATFILSKVVERFFGNRKPMQKKIILALMMGCTIEFFVSLITTANTVGLFSQGVLLYWMRVYASSIPLGIGVGLLMAFIIKPWMNTRISKMEAMA